MKSRICRGTVLLVFGMMQLTGMAAIRLTGDTSEPHHSLFILGQPVVLKFAVSGLEREPNEHLLLAIENEQGSVLQEFDIPLKRGRTPQYEVRYGRIDRGSESLWQIDVKAPAQRLGFYKVNAQLNSGVEVAACCTRPAGFITYAIIPDPTQRRAFPPRETFFGMMGAYAPGLLGQSWQVHNYQMFTWMEFEPDNPRQFNDRIKVLEQEEARGGWAGVPHFVGQHHYQAGGKSGTIPAYSILPIGKPPFWAARNETRAHQNAALNREGEHGFREFCLKLGRYMARKRGNQELHYYQITAEPQIPWGYKGSNEELVRIYEIAYPALHEADPKAVVAGPGFGLDAIEQLEEMLKLGFAKYIDVLDFHPYMGGDVLPSEFGLVQRIRDIRELVNRYAGRQLPITGTEAGFNATGESRELWLRMAWSDIHHNLILLGEGFWLNVCFHGADNSRELHQNTWGHAFNLDSQRDYGVQKTSPKPVVPAYAAMSLLLEGHQSVGAIEWLGEGVTGYAYQREQSVILALWSDEPTQVRVPVGVPVVEVFDWMGNVERLTAEKGVLTLELSRAPHYIRGVSHSIWSSRESVKPLQIEQQELVVLPGDKLKIDYTLHSPGKEHFLGEVVCNSTLIPGNYLSAQKITLQPGKSSQASIEMDVPQNTMPGRYRFSLVLRDKLAPRCGTTTTVVVEPPVAITAVEPLIAENQIGVNVGLQAAATRGIKGKLAMRPWTDGMNRQGVDFELEPGVTRRYQFLWPCNTAAPYCIEAETSVVAGDYPLIKRDVNFAFASAVRVARAPLIDGDPQEWDKIPLLKLGKNALVDGAEKWGGEQDLSAEVRLAWDNQALYILCEVADDHHYQHASEIPYLSWDDSLIVGINLDPHNATIAGGESIEGGVLKRWHEFIFAMRNDGPNWVRAVRVGGYDLRFAPYGDMQRNQLPHSIVRRQQTTVYELALPWRMLGAEKPPAAGSLVGLSLLLRDLDKLNGDRKSTAMQLFNGIFPQRKLQQHGWIILSPAE